MPLAGQRRAHRPRTVAGLLSLLLPGLGQVCTGRVRRGLAWLATAAAVAAVAVLVPSATGVVRVGEVVERMLEPRVLRWLLLTNVALAIVRAAAVTDAARPVAARRSGCTRRGRAVVALSVLLALTLAPHALAGFYGWQAHRVLSTVFVDAAPPVTPAAAETPAPPSPSVTPAAAETPAPPSPVSAPPATDVAEARARATAVETGPSASDADLAPPDAPPGGGRPSWVDGDRLTVALLGSDAGPDRSGARTDAMLVVSVNLDRGDVAAFGVPRNLTGFPLAGGAAAVRDRHCRTDGSWRQLGALYSCLDRHREATARQYPDTPDPAARGVADTLTELTGVPVDHYVVADLSGFVRAVDALGGVRLHVAEPVRTRLSPAEEGRGWIEVDIPAGEQHLDGRQALGFVRSRTGTDDYDRMRRQRCLVGSLAASTGTGKLLRAFPSLADVLVDHVVTDIGVERLPDLVRLRELLDVEELVALGLVAPRYQQPDGRANLARIEEIVRRALGDPQSLRQERTSVEGLDDVCH